MIASGNLANAPRFDTRPLYLQVHDRLVNLITDGTWKAGAMIPNEIELARSFGVSVGTMRKALQVLTDRSVLSRRQGRGTIVSDQSKLQNPRFDSIRDAHGDTLPWRLVRVDVTVGAANAEERTALQLAGDATVVRLRRLWQDLTTGSCLLEYCSLAQSRFPKLSEDADAAMMPISQLARHFGLLPGNAVEEVELCLLAAQESKLARVPMGSPALLLRRTITCLEDIPIEFRVAYCMFGRNVSYLNRTR